MSAVEWIILILKTSVILTVLSAGMRASPRDVGFLLARPGTLARTVVSMYLIMPVIAVAVSLLFHLKPVVELAIVALSLAPVPPLIPKRIIKAGGREDYTVALLATASVISVIVIPPAMGVLARIFGIPLAISAAAIFKIVFTMVLLPLAVGVGLRSLAPSFAERAAGPLGKVATLLLLLGLIPTLLATHKQIFSLIGDGTLAAFAGFCAVGLLAGHLLGGPGPGHKVVLAFCSACRHPGVALAIATANFPDEKLAPMALILYLLVTLPVTTAYLALTRHSETAGESGEAGDKSAPVPGKGGPHGLKPA